MAYRSRKMRLRRRARRQGRRRTTIAKSFLPQHRVVRMRYCESFNVTTTTVANQFAGPTLCCNNLYDPNYSSTGHQPYGYDQMKALYNAYNVLYAKITVTFCNAAPDPCYCLILYNDTTSYSEYDADYVREKPQTTMAFCNSLMTKRLTRWYKPSVSMPGIDASLTGAPILTTSEAPTYVRFWTAAVCSGDPTDAAVNCAIRVKIDYITRWSSPIEVVHS